MLKTNQKQSFGSGALNQSNRRQGTFSDFSIESIIGRDHFSNQSSSFSSSPSLFASKRDSSSLPVKLKSISLGDELNDDFNDDEPSNDGKIKKYRPKNFHCPACQMAFSNNGQLKNHLRKHTGERPFKCNQIDCNKTFTRNEELTRHKLIHTGVRPHTCNSCGKGFGRKDHLKKHVRTHDRKLFEKRLFAFHNNTPEDLSSHSVQRHDRNDHLMTNSFGFERDNKREDLLRQVSSDTNCYCC